MLGYPSFLLTLPADEAIFYPGNTASQITYDTHTAHFSND